MNVSRNITDAVIPLQLAFAWLSQEWAKRHPQGPKLILTNVFRSSAVQRAYYAQSREKLAIVNSLRREAGLDPISEAENRVRITKAKPGSSRHERYPSQAFDIAFQVGKVLDYNTGANFKEAAAIIHEKYPEIIWGADWDNDGQTADETFVDSPHFQVK